MINIGKEYWCIAGNDIIPCRVVNIARDTNGCLQGYAVYIVKGSNSWISILCSNELFETGEQVRKRLNEQYEVKIKILEQNIRGLEHELRVAKKYNPC